MTITSEQVEALGPVLRVTVVSDLVGTVHYHWYRDAAYLDGTETPVHDFWVSPGEQTRIVCLDTLDPAFDPLQNAPAGSPAVRTLFWVRSLSDDVASYRIEQQSDGGDWTTIGTVYPRGEWSFAFQTARLPDLATYAWRIVPVDAAGNDGTLLAIGPERIVRTPDSPPFVVTFDPDAARVTFAIS